MRMVDKIPSTEEVLLEFPGDGGDTGPKLAPVPQQAQMFTFKQRKVSKLETKCKATVTVDVGRVLSADKEYPILASFVLAEDQTKYGVVTKGVQMLRIIDVRFLDDLSDEQIESAMDSLNKIRANRS